MEFNSKYTNAQIENMLDSISHSLPDIDTSFATKADIDAAISEAITNTINASY